MPDVRGQAGHVAAGGARGDGRRVGVPAVGSENLDQGPERRFPVLRPDPSQLSHRGPRCLIRGLLLPTGACRSRARHRPGPRTRARPEEPLPLQPGSGPRKGASLTGVGVRDGGASAPRSLPQSFSDSGQEQDRARGNGATVRGEPGVWVQYSDRYYAANVHDLHLSNLEVVWHAREPMAGAPIRQGDAEELISAPASPPAEAFSARGVVLVEGISDQRALEALAKRHGRNLDAEGVSIVPMGGSKNIGRFLDHFGGGGLRLAGLCDAGEEGDFRGGLQRAGLGSDLTRAAMERLGFYVCVADLEDELIRALGAVAVEEVIAARGELGSFRTFRRQRAWRGRTAQEQLRRFMGTRRGRKIGLAAVLVDALDVTQVPRPLDRVLAHVRCSGPGIAADQS